ncbi:hypothetical protein EDD85DRAFT_946068 [Armillaria nabsnona]|nr:hypothetical protein EDD85DRAFT_946068 [Armillaria nabsnona]
MPDPFPDLTFDSDHVIAPSEPQEQATLYPNDGSTAMNSGTISEAITTLLSDLGPEPPSESLVAGSRNGSVDEQSSSDRDDTSDTTFCESDFIYYRCPPPEDIVFPEVKISAFTETGKMESSIEVPSQRSYTGRRPVIPSSLADTPCATLGIQGVLVNLNATLGTSYTLDTPSLPSILKDCIEKNYDFGTAYGRLRQIWYTDDWSNIRDELRRREEEDRELRRKVLEGNRIVEPYLPPRRLWDLHSNRVVPWWTVDSYADVTREWLLSISHAWVDEKDRIDVMTPINGYEWPVPIPKDASLDLIRIEMLNVGLQGGVKEDLRMEEWKLDVPTIGRMYHMNGRERVVIYLSGLGLPFSVKEGDLDSERCWFRRAWTLQEVGRGRIITGDMPDGPMCAKPIDEDGNYETAADEVLQAAMVNTGCGGFIRSTSRHAKTILAYHESQTLEDAWTALVNSMYHCMRGAFLLMYPGVGLGHKKWRPTWEQVMTETLPGLNNCRGSVQHDDEMDEDRFGGLCIEKGHVHGLDVQSTDGEDRCGELIVESVDRMQHTFAIRATHPIPIPEDTYTLLGSGPCRDSWRAATLDYPCLWSHIILDASSFRLYSNNLAVYLKPHFRRFNTLKYRRRHDSHSLLSTVLIRTASHDLSVNVDYSIGHTDPDESFMMRLLLLRLARKSHQWRNVLLRLPRYMVDDLSVICGQFPKLVSLYLALCNDANGGNRDVITVFEMAPMLAVVTLQGFTSSTQISLSCQQLVHLHDDRNYGRQVNVAFPSVS